MRWNLVWRVAASLIVAVIFALIQFSLPEGHEPDPTISLQPLPILREYWAILRHPRFSTYALAGAFSQPSTTR